MAHPLGQGAASSLTPMVARLNPLRQAPMPFGGEDSLDVNDPGSRVTQRLSCEAQDIERAAAILREGGLVAFPTETVYGLGADATSAEAVAGIYAAKGRPRFNPLIAHLASVDAA